MVSYAPAYRRYPPGALTYAGGSIAFGPGQPTLLVNDQIGYIYERPEVLAELQAGRLDSLIALARAGQQLGIQVVNVQLMEPSLDQRTLVPRAVETLARETGCAIAVDARDPDIVDAALAAYPYKAMCNTVTGELRNLETMLPIIARHGAAVGTALVYEKGVPQTVEERLFVARRIVEAAEAHGIPRQDVMIDAVCLPSSVAPDSMRVTLRTIEAVRSELGAPTLLGISNAGYLMPQPTLIDLAYLIAGVAAGLDVAMVNPATPLLAEEIRAIDFLAGKDPFAKNYLSYYRARRRAQGAAPAMEC
jgi:5-methyltetrahydrofolate--homocysteine methyltransferase